MRGNWNLSACSSLARYSCLHIRQINFQGIELIIQRDALILIGIFQDWKEGAQTSIHLAVSNEGSRATGQYFSDCKVHQFTS